MKNNDIFPCILKEVDDVNYLLSDCADMINNHLKKGDKWEPLTLYLSELLLEGVSKPVVIDVGANLGAYSIPIAKKISSSGGSLYAYEAQRMVYYQCCANIFLNNLKNCYIHHLAISDAKGDIDVPQLDIRTDCNLGALSLDAAIRAQQKIHCNVEGTTERVSAMPLDALALPTIHLLKIDVEGLEYEVISGAWKLLTTSHFPPILFEVWGESMPGMLQKEKNLIAILQNAGYEVIKAGTLALAQHVSNKKVNITLKEGMVSVSLINIQSKGK